MAALHQQDVVDVGAGSGLVQRQATQTNVSGKVFVQHSSSYTNRVLSTQHDFFMCTCPVKPVSLELLAVVPLEHLVDADDVARVVRAGSLVGRVHWRPRDCCHLEQIFLVSVIFCIVRKNISTESLKIFLSII